jgi:5-methylcytosine-specific restriction endonuclease McrA
MPHKDRNQRLAYGRQLRHEYKARNRAYSLEQKTLRGFCEYCGLAYDAAVSHMFHWAHKDPNDKVENVSRLVGRGRNFLVLVNEIAKCRLLCMDCHVHETMSNEHYSHRNAGNEIVIDRNPDQLELDL